MRKVILGVAVSLDGFIEGPNGEYDWCFTDQDYGMSEFMQRIDALVMGRKSYEVAQQYEGESPWKGVTSYVFSRTLQKADKNVVLLRGNLAQEMSGLKQQPGKDIWLFGGADLTTQFIQHNLIDEYWLSVHPIVLGKGKPLFQNLADRAKLKLVQHQVYNTGLVSLTYAPDRSITK